MNIFKHFLSETASTVCNSMELFLVGTLLYVYAIATPAYFCCHAVCKYKAVHQYTCDCLDIFCRYITTAGISMFACTVDIKDETDR